MSSQSCPTSASFTLRSTTGNSCLVPSTMLPSFYENWSPGYDRVFELFGFEPVAETNNSRQREQHQTLASDSSQSDMKFSKESTSFYSSFFRCSHVWRIDERKFNFDMFFIGLRRCYADFCMTMLAKVRFQSTIHSGTKEDMWNQDNNPITTRDFSRGFVTN